MLKSAMPEATVAEAANAREAIAKIRNSQIDLIFLDIQMPELNGMQLVQAIGPSQMPLTVFVTAYDRYAIDAFEANALDYLLNRTATNDSRPL